MAFRGNCHESIGNINFDANKNYFRSNNEGGFIGLVKLLAGENATLAEHIRKCEENSSNGRTNQLTYLNQHFVDRVLTVTRKYLVNTIVNEIKQNGGCFGLLMDGSQDITCQEQFTVVARYVNNKSEIVERTVLFFNAADTSGKALFELLHTSLIQIGLSVSNVIGYSFDGAPNMRSPNVGLNSYIKGINPDAIYTWCLSHRFNLVLKKATSRSDQIKGVVQLAEDSARLFRSSYVKMNIWNDVVTKTPNVSSKLRLKLINSTRWSSKQEAIANIIGNEFRLFALIKSLLKICSLKNLESEALMNAIRISNSWLKYENVVITFVLHKIFSLTVPVTKALQKHGLNILDAVKSLRELKESLDKDKQLLNTFIQQAEVFIGETNYLLSNDVEIIALDCSCCIQLPCDEEKQTFVEKITIEFQILIQILQNEINDTILQPFDTPDSILHEITILDPRIAKQLFSQDNYSFSMKQLCEKNNIMNENIAIQELRVFTSDFLQYKERPKFVAVLNNNLDDSENEYSDYDEELFNFVIGEDSDIEEAAGNIPNIEFQPLNKKICYCLECMLKYICENEERKKKYANIYKIFKYAAILPSTQVKCERDFSKMKITKNRLRSSMCEKTLENLMIISTESDMFSYIDLNRIINEIAKTSTRIASELYK